ncbi:hypothetical protein OY671_011835, partial [Metschnikowia pulcherrima]
AGLQCDQGSRSRDRGRVRGPQGQGGNLRQGAAAAARWRDLCVQHLDAADQFAGRRVEGPVEAHRHPLLLAGREDDAGGDHRRPADQRRDARHGQGTVRAPGQEPHHREERPRLRGQPHPGAHDQRGLLRAGRRPGIGRGHRRRHEAGSQPAHRPAGAG